ncbi:amino acid/amide ABC transporter membrane protein 2, HAAT family [Faunimonas pinastri]|uniref:Amino acid/amide ABC transporter membrane protein 2, HAAT family n=1 Tax=Faunimonas pinastri TaxID=1855383 RepID=A0A1H9ED22_9HYPH|nr:branched-chain amino acid ABC transporter permease [Faunimonas pinastri]SEQ23571.1 amino acid/amide ABC transporter membrane protein 2, HAAT family [Faunimonas pinastri]
MRREAIMRWLLPVIILVIALAAVPFANDYILYVLTIAVLMSTLAVSYDVLLGLTGYLSLAHGFLYGVGAYTAAYLTTNSGWNFWLAMLAAALMSALIGAIVALVAFRTKGIYFAVLTLGIGLVGFQFFLVLEPLTGGVGGFVGIPGIPSLPGLADDPSRNNLVVAIVLLAVTYFAALVFLRSSIGAACLAVREDVTLAQSLGIRVGTARLAAFTFSSAFAGAAGAVFAAISNFVGPDDFSVMATGFQVVVFVVIGGMGTLWGPILGAFLVVCLPEVLRGAATYSVAIYGILLLFFILFAPKGIAGAVLALRRLLPARPASVTQTARHSEAR